MCATQRVLIEGQAHYLIYMERARSFESQARREARDDHFDDDKKEEKYGWRQQHVKPEFGRWSIVEAFPQPVHLADEEGRRTGLPLIQGQAQKKNIKLIKSHTHLLSPKTNQRLSRKPSSTHRGIFSETHLSLSHQI